MWVRENTTKGFSPTGVFRTPSRLQAAERIPSVMRSRNCYEALAMDGGRVSSFYVFLIFDLMLNFIQINFVYIWLILNTWSRH